MRMTYEGHGVWSKTVSGDLDGTYYSCVSNSPLQQVEVADPYSKATGINKIRSMVVNLDALNPDGWDDVSIQKGK